MRHTFLEFDPVLFGITIGIELRLTGRQFEITSWYYCKGRERRAGLALTVFTVAHAGHRRSFASYTWRWVIERGRWALSAISL